MNNNDKINHASLSEATFNQGPTPSVKNNNNNNKSKHRRKCRDTDRPKRPLSAYNLFFQQQRAEMLAALPVRAQGKPAKSHGKIGFKKMARVIGARWKALDDASRAPFQQLAAQEKKRHAHELKLYRQRQLTSFAIHRQPPASTFDIPTTTTVISNTSSRSSSETSLSHFEDEQEPFAGNLEWDPMASFQQRRPQENHTYASCQMMESLQMEPVPFDDIHFPLCHDYTEDSCDPSSSRAMIYEPIPYNPTSRYNPNDMAALASRLDRDLMAQFIRSFGRQEQHSSHTSSTACQYSSYSQ